MPSGPGTYGKKRGRPPKKKVSTISNPRKAKRRSKKDVLKIRAFHAKKNLEFFKSKKGGY